MIKNYSEELKEIIKKYNKEDIVFGKDWDFLYHRVKISQKEVKEEIMNLKNLSFTKKQIKDGETRYVLLFKYSSRKGRQYAITFRENELRVITIFPLGRNTIKRYRKKGLNI